MEFYLRLGAERGGIYGSPAEWAGLLPPGTGRPGRRTLWRRRWGVLALTPEGCADLLTVRRRFPPSARELQCDLLLLPGECPAGRLPLPPTLRAVSYGLSPRDSLTFSSLEQPALCVQRALPRPDGTVIEPQEIPLPGLPAPVERFLPLLGLWLLTCADASAWQARLMSAFAAGDTPRRRFPRWKRG